MHLKRSLSCGLLSVLATVTVQQAQATCCCPRTLCYVPVSNLRGYVDLGYQRALSAELPSSTYEVLPGTGINFSLFPQGKFTKNNLFVETGLLWTQPFPHYSPYFPYANLGLRYQTNNVDGITVPMTLNIMLDDINFTDTAPYKFMQNSLWTTAKVDVYRWDRFMPYVSGAIGITWHQVKPQNSFSFLKIKDVPLATYVTAGDNTREFSYNLGAGVDYMVTNNFWLSLGYQYTYYGDISAKASGVAINTNVAVGADEEVKKEFEKIEEKLKDKIEKLKEQASKTAIVEIPNPILKPFHFKHLNTHSIQLTGRYLFG